MDTMNQQQFHNYTTSNLLEQTRKRKLESNSKYGSSRASTARRKKKDKYKFINKNQVKHGINEQIA